MVLQLNSDLPLGWLLPHQWVLQQLLGVGPLHVILHQAALDEAVELFGPKAMPDSFIVHHCNHSYEQLSQVSLYMRMHANFVLVVHRIGYRRLLVTEQSSDMFNYGNRCLLKFASSITILF